MDTRETALLLFVEMEKTKNFGSSLIRDTLNKYDYEDPREKAFLKRLTEGTLESLLTLDYVINAYSKTPDEQNETADPQSAAPVGLSNFVYGHRAGFCGMQRSRASGKEKGL